jgi:leucyl/phenylalanyl-tRNA--protein transferase
MSELNDIVAVGLDLKPKTLLHAYSQGVFPWPTEGLPLLWHCPSRRGVLEFESLHVPRRLKSYLRQAPWTFTIDHAFDRVIEACSIREDEGTWITPEMKEAYCELHRLGHAHSVEVWNGTDLVGGMYGVDSSGYFAGESMFHRESNASKAALLFGVSRQLIAGREWMDIQVLTPHMEALGAREITRSRFLRMLDRARENQKITPPDGPFRPGGPYTYRDFSTLME